MGFLERRLFKDKALRWVMLGLTVLSLFIFVVMGAGLYEKSQLILGQNSLWKLLTESDWQPTAGRFGFFAFIAGSVYVTLLAVVLAVPVALLTAVFLTEYARPWILKTVFPVLDILASIPSVVYGVWGVLVIVPWIADKVAPHFVEYSSGYTLLAGGIVLSVMVLPLLVSLFVEIFRTVPHEIKEASASLGATRWQTTRKVMMRKSMPGIIAAVALALSRAFGETLAVLMVCGNTILIPSSVFEACYPLPALIANNYGEMLSVPVYESALMFAALVLFVVILVFNVVSRVVLQHVERRFKL